jgi:DNA-binding HxlR family transcriptional regulator
MFVPGASMKDAVAEVLREGDMSISSLHRKLEAEGFKMHRLVLTGYLRALEDTGVLKAKEIPPSRVYSAAQSSEMSVYETVGALAMSTSRNEAEASRVAVYCLQRLFRRPVFLEELRRAGFSGEIEAERISGEERNEARRMLARKGHRLPDNDPAYRAPHSQQLEEAYKELVASALLSRLKAHSLVVETKQTRLE